MKPTTINIWQREHDELWVVCMLVPRSDKVMTGDWEDQGMIRRRRNFHTLSEALVYIAKAAGIAVLTSRGAST